MTHQFSLSDDRYQAIVEIAAAQGKSPDAVLAALIDEAWERACAPYDVAFQNDPDWQATAREAAARSDEPHGAIYPSTAAFLEALGASQSEVAQVR